MYKVVEVKRKGKNYLIYIEDSSKVSDEYLVSEDLIIEYRLIKGKTFDLEFYNNLIQMINRDKYYQKVLKYSLFKPRTEKEIIDYLDRLSIDNKSFYLEKLKKIKIINDNLYTENYISDSINLKHIGPRKIYEDLKFKGISQELITEKIIVYNKKEMLENIEYWLDKKIKMSSNIPMMKLKNQLKSFLVNKGFNFDDISSIISKKEDDISSSVNEDKIIIKEIENLKTKYNKKGLKMSLNQFLTSKLLAKGYQYSTIKKFL